MRKRVVSIALALTMLQTLCPLPVALAVKPQTLTAEDFSGQQICTKTFDRTNEAWPDIQAKVNGETVKLSYKKAYYEKKGAGKSNVIVTGLYLSDEYEGYVLEDGFTTLTLPGQILPQQTTIRNGEVEIGGTLDLWSLIDQAGTVGCTIGSVLDVDIIAPADKLGCEEPTGDGILTAGNTTGVLTLEATVSEAYWDSDEIPDYTGTATTFTVTITEPGQDVPPVDPPAIQKLPQEPLVIQGEREVTYGQTLQLSCSGGSTGQQVIWGFAGFEASGQATISPKGLFTPVKAGEIWVTATMPGDDTYQDAVSDAFPITIRPAAITITAHNKTAVVGDEIPALTADDYTVTGLVGDDQLAVQPTLSYESPPDMAKAGEVTIQITGALPPAGGNYELVHVPGKLIIGEAYPITIGGAEGGTVTADMTQAPAGATVTLAAQPDEGFALDSLKVESGSTVLEITEAGEGKFTFTMPEGGVLVTPVFTEAPPAELPFTDVAETDWFYQSVAYVYGNGLMNGTSETTFSPGGTTTRGMIVTILYRLAGSPEGPGSSPFQDVASDQYYAAPVAWAAWNGIVNGKTATAFGPNDPITREQMAAILYRYASSQGMEVSQRGDLTKFSDREKISSYAREALSWANGAGLITGKGEGILDPQGPAVRAQVAAIFQRFCENTER